MDGGGKSGGGGESKFKGGGQWGEGIYSLYDRACVVEIDGVAKDIYKCGVGDIFSGLGREADGEKSVRGNSDAGSAALDIPLATNLRICNGACVVNACSDDGLGGDIGDEGIVFCGGTSEDDPIGLL